MRRLWSGLGSSGASAGGLLAPSLDGSPRVAHDASRGSDGRRVFHGHGRGQRRRRTAPSISQWRSVSESPPNGYVTYRELNAQVKGNDDRHEAEVRRTDELREAETRRTDDLREMEAKYVQLLTMAESRRLDAVMTAEARRIDANRSTDVAAVVLANARAELTAAALAERVDTSAKALAEGTAATAKAAAISVDSAAVALGGRIKPLEDARYEQAGRHGGQLEVAGAVKYVIGIILGSAIPVILFLSGHVK